MGTVATWLVCSPPGRVVWVDEPNGRGHYVVFLDITLNFRSASLHLGV